MTTARKPEEQVLELIRHRAWQKARSELDGWHPADIVDLLEQAPENTRPRVFRLLAEGAKPEVLAELDQNLAAELLTSLNAKEIADIAKRMAPDDAADVLANLPAERSQRVLSLMEKDESADIRRLLEYEADTAGGIMTTDVVALREDQTVAEALDAITSLDTAERFQYANIVERRGRMVGFVDVWELLRERNRQRPLGELVHTDFIAVDVAMDQEQVARLMSRYGLSVVPVLDSQGRLVGRVTADDVIDVMEEEASEDIFRMAGSDDAELGSRSVLRSCILRLPWLLVTLAGSTVTSMILKTYHAYISHIMVLGAFVPAVLAMGGNTGIQSSTLIVRSIALGTLKRGRVAVLLLKEIATGALMGCVCGVGIGFFAHFVVAGGSPASGFAPGYLGLIVATALFSAMTFAAVFGAVVPIILHKTRVDPAMASGPFITVANDISALLIYFGVTILMITRAA